MTAANVSVNAHIKSDTTLSFRSYPADNRVVVELGGIEGEVALFLPRAEIDRLAGVLVEAQESLSVSAVKSAA